MQKSKLQVKTKNFLLRLWPMLFVVSIWFIFSCPYFLKGLVPYASTYQVNFFPPWSYYEEFGSPIKNNAMPDVHSQIYPWKKFTIDTYRSGSIPLWNPYSFAGTPHLANFQSAVISPLNLLFFVLPFIDAWSILILLQPLLAGLFTYLFMRSLKVSEAGSLLASITFMFCGFIVVWMAYGTLAYAILYLPLALFGIEKFYATEKAAYLLLLSISVPLSFFSGHFQISLYLLAAAVSYIFFKGIVTKRVFYTALLFFSAVLGILFTTVQIAPSLDLYSHSVRSELFAVGEVIPFQYLVTSIAPDFFGNPVTRNDWFGHYAEWAGFIGVWPLILAIYALFKRNSTAIFFGVLGVAALLLSLNSPLASVLASLKIPVISTSALSRIIVLFSFSFAVLAGFGFDQLKNDLEKRKALKKITIIFTAAGLFFVSVWSILLLGQLMPIEWLTVAKRNFVLPTFLFIAGVILILLSMRNKRLILFALCYLLFAISFDSLRFAQKWMPFDPLKLVYPDVPIAREIKRNIGDGRIFGNLGSEFTVYYGVGSIEGYDPLYINRYGEFIQSASIGQPMKAERSVVHLDRNGRYTDRVLDLLGVTLIFHPIADTNQGWAYPVWKDEKRHTRIYQDNIFELYRNNAAMPRASLFYNFEVIKNDPEIIKRFYSENFDFRNVLILSDDPGITRSSPGQGAATIISYTPNTVRIIAQTENPALLFLSDTYYPGWRVWVNGFETRIFMADYTFRAVVIPAGTSEVIFTYYEDWYF